MIHRQLGPANQQATPPQSLLASSRSIAHHSVSGQWPGLGQTPLNSPFVNQPAVTLQTPCQTPFTHSAQPRPIVSFLCPSRSNDFEPATAPAPAVRGTYLIHRSYPHTDLHFRIRLPLVSWRLVAHQTSIAEARSRSVTVSHTLALHVCQFPVLAHAPCHADSRSEPVLSSLSVASHRILLRHADFRQPIASDDMSYPATTVDMSRPETA